MKQLSVQSLRLTQGSLKLSHVVIGLCLCNDHLHAGDVLVNIFGSLCIFHRLLGSVQPEKTKSVETLFLKLFIILQIETFTSYEEWKTCLWFKANCMVEVDNSSLWASIPYFIENID